MQIHVIGTLAVPAGGVAGDVLTRTGTGAGTAWQAPTGGVGGGTDPEQVRDIIGGTLVAGANITITPNDPGDVVTIAVSSLTKATVGLANVDNTSDANKPLSSAMITALGDKASTSDLAAKADLSALASKADASTVAGKADNTAVVHLTGAETIAGVKTFSSAPVLPANALPISRVNLLQASLDAKVETDAEIAAAALLDELSTTAGLISGRRLIAAIDSLVGVQAVRWSGSAWIESPRASAKVRLFFSQNDVGATAPLGNGPWDLWWQAPGA